MAITEDEVFELWRSATGEEKEKLEQQLQALLHKHAMAVIYQRTSESKPGLANLAVWRALKKVDQFKGDSKFSTWFQAIVQSLCIDSWRARRNMPEQGLDDNLAASGIDDAALDAKKLVEKIEKDCTPAERKLLEMKKQGLSTEEMAAEIGCSDTAVRKRLSRLFNKIRERWGDATTGSAGESSSSNSEA